MLSSLFFPSKSIQLSIFSVGYISRKPRRNYLNYSRAEIKHSSSWMQKDLSQRFLQGRGVWRESDFLGLPIHPRIELWILLFPGELSPFRETFEKQMNFSTLFFFLRVLPLIQWLQDTPNTPAGWYHLQSWYPGMNLLLRQVKTSYANPSPRSSIHFRPQILVRSTMCQDPLEIQ